jgi:hypothetical protein
LQAADRGGDLGGQGQLAASRSGRRRPLRARRPAAENSRSRSRLGSQARAGPARASIAIQAVSSQAMATSSHQIWVLAKAVQGQVPQASVLGAPDPVLAAGPAPVPQFEVSELPGGGVGGEAGDAVPADVGEPQVRAGHSTQSCPELGSKR